jgi:hypothetical protein
MLEDFRDHDPNPTVHERAWMETNPYPVILRVALLGAIATIVGLSASSGDPLVAAQPGNPSVAALRPLDQ